MIQEIAVDRASTMALQRTSLCDPIQVSPWKRLPLNSARGLFTWIKKTNDNEDGQATKPELLQQIDRLPMQRKCSKQSPLL